MFDDPERLFGDGVTWGDVVWCSDPPPPGAVDPNLDVVYRWEHVGGG